MADRQRRVCHWHKVAYRWRHRGEVERAPAAVGAGKQLSTPAAAAGGGVRPPSGGRGREAPLMSRGQETEILAHRR